MVVTRTMYSTCVWFSVYDHDRTFPATCSGIKVRVPADCGKVQGRRTAEKRCFTLVGQETDPGTTANWRTYQVPAWKRKTSLRASRRPCASGSSVAGRKRCGQGRSSKFCGSQAPWTSRSQRSGLLQQRRYVGHTLSYVCRYG